MSNLTHVGLALVTLNLFGNDKSEYNINNELNKVKLNKLSLNSTKTKAMLFHTAQRMVQYPDIFIDDSKIEFVECFNLLGIVLDSKLNWGHHVDIVCKKISKTAGIINKLKNIIPINALINIYNSLVLLYINYGLFIWGMEGQKYLNDKEETKCSHQWAF